ncbi:hypothetical protein [Paenibacillus xylanexedens]|uniref:Uncharacterized protein n=1 Tax=Paenibacillus xylanexedens TaxID=528191 RepID=A0ABS4RPZ2_PAEXY|nr:hypothetical protein [Paenibacillus xylanexedens]MBP2243842.1 hypothetical protein [Paenibacillus xylanexedens]
MKVPPTNRNHFLQMAKIASERGTLTETLKRVYLMNYAKAVKREKAAVAAAAQEIQISNYI